MDGFKNIGIKFDNRGRLEIDVGELDEPTLKRLLRGVYDRCPPRPGAGERRIVKIISLGNYTKWDMDGVDVDCCCGPGGGR